MNRTNNRKQYRSLRCLAPFPVLNCHILYLATPNKIGSRRDPRSPQNFELKHAQKRLCQFEKSSLRFWTRAEQWMMENFAKGNPQAWQWERSGKFFINWWRGFWCLSYCDLVWNPAYRSSPALSPPSNRFLNPLNWQLSSIAFFVQKMALKNITLDIFS